MEKLSDVREVESSTRNALSTLAINGNMRALAVLALISESLPVLVHSAEQMLSGIAEIPEGVQKEIEEAFGGRRVPRAVKKTARKSRASRRNSSNDVNDSNREEIESLLRQGLTSKQVADRLKLKTSTVAGIKAHMTRGANGANNNASEAEEKPRRRGAAKKTTKKSSARKTSTAKDGKLREDIRTLLGRGITDTEQIKSVLKSEFGHRGKINGRVIHGLRTTSNGGGVGRKKSGRGKRTRK